MNEQVPGKHIQEGEDHQDKTEADLGICFGESLYAREVDYFVAHEWAATADDILWRRTKAGLALDDNSQMSLARYIARQKTDQAARFSHTTDDLSR